MRPLRAATRGSPLALAQTTQVAALLGGTAAEGRAGTSVETVVVSTEGDGRPDAPLWTIGGRGVFVKEVQAAVLDGRADLAVHSAKDLPSTDPPGLVIAAVPRRGDARDVLVGRPLALLPPGARVGTGSVRRRAQLAWVRPDLTFGHLRGNLGTRLARASAFDAIVVAAAALDRLGRRAAASQHLPTALMVPQAGQGALAVECRSDDGELREILATIDHGPSRRAVETERAFLRAVGGGCDLPVGAYAEVVKGGSIRLSAVVATLDGRVVMRHGDEGCDPEELGSRVAAFLLDDAGGRQLSEGLVSPWAPAPG